MTATDVSAPPTAPNKSGKGAVILWTFLRWTLAFLLVYGYALLLGSTLAKTPDGWVTQNVELGPVDIVGSEESPIGLQSTNLEWVDQNHVLQRKDGVIVGNVPVDQRCDVKVVPPGFKASTTTSISTTTTLFGSRTTSTTAPPDSTTSSTTTTTGPKPIPGTTKVDDVKTGCAQAIEIRYDPAKPAQTVQVVGAKDLEVGLPALLYLIFFGTVGFFAFLISLGSNGFPPNEPKGSVVGGLLKLVLGIGCLVVGPFIVWEQPVLAMSMVVPAIYLLMRGSTSIRRKLRKRDPHAILPGAGPQGGATPGAQPWTPPAPVWTPQPQPQGPSPAGGQPPPWPGGGPAQAPQAPQPPTPWSNPPPQPSFQPPPKPPEPEAGGTTSF